MPPDTTCSPTSKDTTIVSGSIPPSGISPPNRQSAKPLNPVSTKSQEGQSAAMRRAWSTGPYHRAFEHALAKAGLPLVKVNPRQARRFAEATGKLAKTARLDAALLARMGALLAIEPRPARSKALAELKELHIAREALVKDRTAAKNRAKIRTLALLKRQNAQRLDQIERQIAAIEDRK